MFVALCPHPPLLVPRLDPHDLPELVAVRAAAREVVADLLRSEPDVVTVLAAGTEQIDHDELAGGTLDGHGVTASAGGRHQVLPLSATIGAWLLDDAGWRGRRRYVDASADAALEEAEALLVMADGTACRTERAPGYLDERAEGFDADVAAALASGDTKALAMLDLSLAAELAMGGGPVLVALGEQVQARRERGADVVARLRHESAPLGVGYWVADWQVG
ncbi:hypothetical protein [Aeromicrobium sp. CTD01-1L150]|uniref:hypothetical protein n=1 Tax=Aeromicrobium sp. CTD01-1L150 TaxID=3341830 RepID=UPI0035C150E9